MRSSFLQMLQISDQISFLEDTAINVTRMRELIRATNVGQVMVLLDACRNDPGGRADAPNPLTEAYVNGFNFDVRNREVQAFATIYATTVGQRAYEYTERKQGYFTWAIVEGLKGAASNSAGEVTLSELVKFVQDAQMDESIDDSVWVGTSPGGDKFYELRFNRGGVFSGNFVAGASLMAAGQNKLDGTWSQAGNAVSVTISSGSLKSHELKATRTGNAMKGSWTQLTYSFEVTRVYTKPIVTNDADEVAPCNLRGMKITVFYRVKGGVNLSDAAAQVAEKLRGTNATIEVQKGNEKNWAEKVVFYNGQSQIAAKIAECVGDSVPITPADAGANFFSANLFQIYLQTPVPSAVKPKY